MNAIALAYDSSQQSSHVNHHVPSPSAQDIIDQLPVGVGVEDADGVILECNQAFADYYSMAPLDLVGIGFMERMELVCPHVVEVNGQAVPSDGPMASYLSFQTMRCDARGAIQTTLRDGRSFRHERRSLAGGKRLVVVTELTAIRRLEAELRAMRTPSSQSASSASKLADEAAACSLDDRQEAHLGSCSLDMRAARLFRGDGSEIPLTPMEFSLLRTFIENRGRILNRDQLLADAHTKGWERFDRSIDLRISRIRKKIETNPSNPQIIRTVRGLGYILD